MRLTSAIAATLILTLFLSGCGSSDEDQVRTTLRAFFSAMAEGDGATACSLLTPSYRRGMAEATGASDCPRGVEANAESMGWEGRRAMRVSRVEQVTIGEGLVWAVVASPTPAGEWSIVGAYGVKQTAGAWRVDGFEPGE